jgi:predicted nucleic acid-binding Zn ribbon protein
MTYDQRTINFNLKHVSSKNVGNALVAGASSQAGTTRLGVCVRMIIEQKFEPMILKNDSVLSIWQQILPEELRGHCQVVQLANGVLKAKVDSTVYLYSAQCHKQQLLEQLQRDCPKARIRKVCFVVG